MSQINRTPSSSDPAYSDVQKSLKAWLEEQKKNGKMLSMPNMGSFQTSTNASGSDHDVKVSPDITAQPSTEKHKPFLNPLTDVKKDYNQQRISIPRVVLLALINANGGSISFDEYDLEAANRGPQEIVLETYADPFKYVIRTEETP